MKQNCFNFNNYSINGNAIHEGHGIDKFGGLFIWYYTERGQKDNLKYFQTEKEVVEFAYNEVKADKWAKTHCVGVTSEKAETEELANKLRDLGVEYLQDQIPYGLHTLVYRTFVLGCDVEKVSYLKDKYYKEKL